MEAQTSAQSRASFIDVIANLAPAGESDHAFARQIRHTSIESALGEANAAGA